MITQNVYVLKISKQEAEEKAVFTYPDSNYDDIEGELTYKVNNSTEINFRLVHNGVKVFDIVEGEDNTITSSLNIIEDFTTKQLAFDRIKDLGLDYVEQ